MSILLKPSSEAKIFININTKAKNYSGSGNEMCIKDGWVVIRGSKHLCGNLCKGTMGSGTKNGLFYSIIRDFGSH